MSRTFFKPLLIVIFGFFLISSFSSCAPSGLTLKKHGFTDGIGHGFVSPFVIAGKIFGKETAVIAEYHTGFTYKLGFGIGILLVGFLGLALYVIPGIAFIVLWLLYYFGKI